MSTFDPRLCKPLSETLSVVPKHGEGWNRKWANWWGGATIASPTPAMTVPANQSLMTMRRLAGDVGELNAYYIQETEYLRQWVRDVTLLEAGCPIILDASGTAAILTATRMLAHVALGESRELFALTTDEGGSLVPAALRGLDPNQMENVMFQPVTAAYFDPEPVIPYPAGTRVSHKVMALANKNNQQLVEAIREVLSGVQSPAIVLLPHVSKTGRILPIREVGQVVADLRAQGKPVYLVVDDIQGIGRVHPDAIANPLSFCDAYVVASSKALGGILIASAFAVRAEYLERFLKGIEGTTAGAPWFSHFQLSPAFEDRLHCSFLKPGALSLPELVSMRVGLYSLFQRGNGVNYGERRRNQLSLMQNERQRVVDAVKGIPGLEVLESSAQMPLVSSIICLRSNSSRWAPAAVKDALQSGEPIITPSAPIGRYLRLDLPEYRSVPSVEVLVKGLSRILG